jgi:membrane-associated phospholipid phosphatase
MMHRITGRRKQLLLVCIVVMFMFSQSLYAYIAPRDTSLVNPFDRMAMFPYNHTLSIASDVTQYISLLAPAAFALVAPTQEWFEISALYATSALLSFGTRTVMKMGIERYRPYTYDDYPYYDDAALEEEKLESFPSGHSIMAFTGAAFTQALFLLRYPDNPYRKITTAAAWSFAAATAILRVTSGHHFVTDVLAGAAIGSFFGFAVPYLAWKLLPSWQGEHISVAVGPTAAMVQIQF